MDTGPSPRGPSTVVVAMSGGVDSSVSAALLRDAGHQVIGVSMRLAAHSEASIADARAVAGALGIPFEVAELEERFEQAVVSGFVDDYLAGRTPNPCAVCNARVKFGLLLARARSLGARLATGHYARVERRGERLALCRAPHGKDQSYFLYALSQEVLRDVLFPVGALPKEEVRALARRLRLPVAERPESQEICFVADEAAWEFVERRAPSRVRGGQVVSTRGEVVGRHAGIHRFTVGQRRGLGLGGGGVRYVTRIDGGAGAVVVGTGEEASRGSFAVRDVRWVAGRAPARPVAALVQVRHRHEGVRGEVRAVEEAAAVVTLARKVRGVAPGQAAVFYDGDEVLGGGRIVEEGAGDA